MNKEIYIGMKVMAEIDGGYCTGIVEYIGDERCGIEFGDPIGYQVINIDGVVCEIEKYERN